MLAAFWSFTKGGSTKGLGPILPIVPAEPRGQFLFYVHSNILFHSGK